MTGCPKGCSIPVTCSVTIPHQKLSFGYPSGEGAAPSGCPGFTGGMGAEGAIVS